jgi:hypothetical protein
MVITILIGIIVTIFAYFSGKSNNERYLFIAFSIIFIFLALRYDFGNDYMAYFDKFYEVDEASWNELRDVTGIDAIGESMEFGFIFLLKIFTVFSGYYFFIAFHSLLICLLFFYLIKNNVEIQYYWFAIFLFVFNPNLMLVELSALRQTLAILCFLFSIKYLINRNIVKYLLFILLASSFHLSAIILVPLYFLFTPKPVGKYEPIIYIVLFLFFMFFGSLLLSPLESITSTYLPKYISYVDDGEKAILQSGFGIIIYSFIYLFILLFAKRENDREIVIYRIVALFIVLTPLSLALNMLSRLNFYFEPLLIVVIPQILSSNFNKTTKLFFVSIIVFMSLVSTYSHFKSPIYREKYNTYKTILTE